MTNLNNGPDFSYSLIISSKPVQPSNAAARDRDGTGESRFGPGESFDAFEGSDVELLGYEKAEHELHSFKVLKMGDERSKISRNKS